jgi:LmbE family N-acetylglucosaminyl deacetylase
MGVPKRGTRAAETGVEELGCAAVVAPLSREGEQNIIVILCSKGQAACDGNGGWGTAPRREGRWR